MSHSRTCPVCLTPNAIIRPDAKTCSRECSKSWNKMSRNEQQARVASVDPAIQEAKLMKDLKSRPPQFVDEVIPDDVEGVDLEDIPASSDVMPKGILPE